MSNVYFELEIPEYMAKIITIINSNGTINDIQKRFLDTKHVYEAIKNASDDFVEGDVGAGTGMKCHGFKGGIHCLEIFDYLSDKNPDKSSAPHEPWRVIYAGNLGRWRNQFLYE